MTKYFYALAGAMLLTLMACERPTPGVEFVRTDCADSVLLVPGRPTKSPVCHARISLVMLKDATGGALADVVERINAYVIRELLPGADSLTAQTAANAYIRRQTQEFPRLVSEMYDEDLRLLREDGSELTDSDAAVVRQSMIAEYSYEYDIQTEAHLGRADSIVCYTIKAYEDTGGAHGMTTYTTLSFSLRTGHVVSVDEVFAPQAKEELCRRIVGRIIKMQGVKDAKELEELGFVDGEGMYVPNNMLLDPDSVVFRFNAYDIAPYVFGDIRVGFRYDEVRDLIVDN